MPWVVKKAQHARRQWANVTNAQVATLRKFQGLVPQSISRCPLQHEEKTCKPQESPWKEMADSTRQEYLLSQQKRYMGLNQLKGGLEKQSTLLEGGSNTLAFEEWPHHGFSWEACIFFMTLPPRTEVGRVGTSLPLTSSFLTSGRLAPAQA